ncbi:MAG TPA: hypothetical protein VK150_06360, partial [Geothrix sp.]|nr:hypothetical protein [Geothrix sp.]
SVAPPHAWAPTGGPEVAEVGKPRMQGLHGHPTSPTAEGAEIPARNRTARCDGPGPRGRAGVSGIRH